MTVSPSGCRVRNGEDETVVTQRTEEATIRFDAALSTIDTSTVLRLPETASKNLPSRGQVAVHGTINGVEFQTVLEPDGNFGHWMRVDDTLQHGGDHCDVTLYGKALASPVGRVRRCPGDRRGAARRAGLDLVEQVLTATLRR